MVQGAKKTKNWKLSEKKKSNNKSEQIRVRFAEVINLMTV